MTVCRVCLGNNPSEPVEGFCRRMMMNVFTFPMAQDDCLPNKICRKCYRKVSSAFKLKILAKKSYDILININRISENSTKTHSTSETVIDKTVSDLQNEIADDNSFDSRFDDSDNIALGIYLGKKDSNTVPGISCEDLLKKNDETVILPAVQEEKVTCKINKRRGKVKRTELLSQASSSVCHLCGKQVTNIKEHNKLHDKNRKRIPCSDCTKTFASFGARRKHELVHHLGVLYYCEICKKHYKNGYEHKRIVHSNLPKPHACLLCDKRYRSGALLKFHMTIHTKERPFSCADCGKLFRTQALCTLHRRRVHEGERKFICQYCSKGFFSNHHLTIHLKTHTQEKNYKCNLCGKLFLTCSAVRLHEKRHSGVKTVKCTVCEMAFINNGALKSHMISHTKEKKFECKYCGVKFGRSDHRNRHEKTSHESKILQTL
ncbi:uncharacterized protein LOC143911110 isoform X2 [Arctopsyche grandis]|uniref:uncharacterized protein LOC143911110 isoform X2 n=1 Tax=Arctopsyche grandis TaxID=121162 RepID=UPI00406D7F86